MDRSNPPPNGNDKKSGRCLRPPTAESVKNLNHSLTGNENKFRDCAIYDNPSPLNSQEKFAPIVTLVDQARHLWRCTGDRRHRLIMDSLVRLLDKKLEVERYAT